MGETDQPTDQDIDTAGTEADDGFRERHGGKPPEPPDPTEGPLGVAPGSEGVPRDSDHRTIHRGRDS
jgi:hypothetical protein